MGVPFAVIDAFTDAAFAGNPAAVCLLPADPPAPHDPAAEAAWMQRMAAEFNLSETAFVRPGGGEGFELRWFTPRVEVDLCGHATLASAHFLWERRVAAAGDRLRFHTRSGSLAAVREGDWIELDFPSEPPERVEPPEGLGAALGVEAVAVWRNRLDYFVEVGSEAEVRELAPDLRRLAPLVPRGVAVTAPGAGPGYDFVSRFFAPAVGVDEDPVTGSAHCGLAPLWFSRLGRDCLVGRQVSARGGTVRVRAAGDRVRLGGTAVTVARGELVAVVGSADAGTEPGQPPGGRQRDEGGRK